MKHLLSIGCLVLLLSNSHITPHTISDFMMPTEWELVSKDGSLQVYKRDKPGSSYKEIRIENVVEGTVEDVVHYISYAEGYKDWIYKCSVSEHVATINENEFVYYTIADLPFPLWDRDIVAKSRHWVEGGTHHFISENVSGYKEEQNKIIRVEEFSSSWEVKDVGDGKVSIINQIHMNPGGNIPAWLVNMSVAKGPKKTMQGLQEMIK